MAVSHLNDLRSQARALPETPGVYFWKDRRGKTLYIGKAINLRARVTSYFSNAVRDRRTRELLTSARSVEYEVTETELEALFRESVLIKQYLPRFNRSLLRSGPEYFIKFDRNITDPYMELSSGREDDGSLYFGPFRSRALVRETMDYLHAVLPLRKCTRVKPACRPCVYYQMRTCAGPLVDNLHRQRHQDAIHQLFDLLDGRTDRVTKWLRDKRDRLSESMLFEQAAEIQARLDALGQLQRKQVILDAAVQCRCVLIHQRTADSSASQLLLVAHGTVISVRDGEIGPDAVMRWISAHRPIIEVTRRREKDVDAALVLERWLHVRRDNLRWVAVRNDSEEGDLFDRVSYVLENGAKSGPLSSGEGPTEAAN